MPRANDSTPFAETEQYYADHRPGYGDSAIRYLRERFTLDEATRVLDLGCGTGQIAIPLSEHVGEVVGMDPNEAMLREARANAEAAGRTNIEWTVGSDADLEAELGPFRLTTMGRSFHWMDQKRTLDHVHHMTESGGGVALLNDDEWLTRGEATWQSEVYDIAAEYIVNLPERTGPIEEYDDPWDELIADFGFVDVESYVSESEREWSVDDVVGYLFSLSFCSPTAFDGDRDAFEADVRALLADDERDVFTQNAELTIVSGRKPEPTDS